MDLKKKIAQALGGLGFGVQVSAESQGQGPLEDKNEPGQVVARLPHGLRALGLGLWVCGLGFRVWRTGQHEIWGPIYFKCH